MLSSAVSQQLVSASLWVFLQAPRNALFCSFTPACFGISPLASSVHGHTCLPAGRARLLSFLKPSLGGLLWRTAKADVAHELGLPPQHQNTSSLQFSAIERHFYTRQHAECSSRAKSAISVEVLSQAAQGLAEERRLTAGEEKKLLWPLLRLRQACCHPQVRALPVCFLLRFSGGLVCCASLVQACHLFSDFLSFPHALASLIGSFRQS